MTGLVAAFRAACLGGAFDWGQIAISTLVSAVMLIVGCFYFRRVERHFADII
jgi:ABC-type polysaccharide/polyol phosphate export permease